MTPSRDISRLIAIMAQLRTPVTGCPWDLEQNFQTIAPYTIEEAYEVADAIARNDRFDMDLTLIISYRTSISWMNNYSLESRNESHSQHRRYMSKQLEHY